MENGALPISRALEKMPGDGVGGGVPPLKGGMGFKLYSKPPDAQRAGGIQDSREPDTPVSFEAKRRRLQSRPNQHIYQGRPPE